MIVPFAQSSMKSIYPSNHSKVGVHSLCLKSFVGIGIEPGTKRWFRTTAIMLFGFQNVLTGFFLMDR